MGGSCWRPLGKYIGKLRLASLMVEAKRQIVEFGFVLVQKFSPVSFMPNW